MSKLSKALCLSLSITSLCYAFCDANTSKKPSDLEINAIFKLVRQHPQQTISERLELISAQWLDKPYLLYCLGEGAQGEFDQRPIYRTDGFDCETLVDTTLAMANSNDLKSFNQKIRAIRYHDKQVDFTHRNHFTNIDWNRSNQQQGFIKDITQTITYRGKPIAIKNQIIINKSQWYQKMSENRIFLIHDNPKKKQEKLQQLRAQAKTQGQALSKLYYLPIKALFNQHEQPIDAIFAQIPNGTIIEIVTPQSHTAEKIGTDLDISHMGFAFKINGVLYFRNASLIHKKVVDTPLADYLKTYLKSATIKGIHLELPLEKQS